jgi:hypothetical protein
VWQGDWRADSIVVTGDRIIVYAEDSTKLPLEIRDKVTNEKFEVVILT